MASLTDPITLLSAVGATVADFKQAAKTAKKPKKVK
jgi:hypothetical protein